MFWAERCAASLLLERNRPAIAQMTSIRCKSRLGTAGALEKSNPAASLCSLVAPRLLPNPNPNRDSLLLHSLSVSKKKKSGSNISISTRQHIFSSQRKNQTGPELCLPPNTRLQADPRQSKLPPPLKNSYIQLQYKTPHFCLWTQLLFKLSSALQAARGIYVHTTLGADDTPFWMDTRKCFLFFLEKTKHQLISAPRHRWLFLHQWSYSTGKLESTAQDVSLKY